MTNEIVHDGVRYTFRGVGGDGYVVRVVDRTDVGRFIRHGTAGALLISDVTAPLVRADIEAIVRAALAAGVVRF